MTLIALVILGFAGIVVAARLGLDFGFERGYRAGVEDSALTLGDELEAHRIAERHESYLRKFGAQIDAGRRGEN